MTDEERALWDVYIQTGRTDTSIRNRLVELHRGWAENYARAICTRFGRRFDADDAAGNISLELIELVERYDPSRGIPFRGYAAHHVYGAGRDAAMNYGIFTRDQAKNMARRGNKILSTTRHTKAGGTRIYDIPTRDDPSLGLVNGEIWEWVGSVLNDRDSALFRRMLNGETATAIAKELGTSRTLVSLAYRRARMKLARSLGVEPARRMERAVECIDTGERFESVAAAARAKDEWQATITAAANKGYRAAGLRWKWIKEQCAQRSTT